ncbi:MAG TPA: hypothetical protein DEH78_03550 [Solibacterales bacterium]|nr:hypothetical protein [Bryobacterales bacterium]
MPSARLSDFDVRRNVLLFVFASKQQSEIVVMSREGDQSTRWSLPGHQRFGRLLSDRTAALGGYVQTGGIEVCEYSLDGRRSERCFALDKSVEFLETSGSDLIGFSVESIHFLKWTGTSSVSALFGGEFPWWKAVQGQWVVAVSGVDGTLTTVNLATGARATHNLLSDRLDAIRVNQEKDQALIGKMSAWEQWIFCVPASYNTFVGLPVDVFDLSGRLISAITLRLPQFKELRRGPSPTTRLQNPTGHPVANFFRIEAGRLYLVDRIAGRVVYYDLPGELNR